MNDVIAQTGNTLIPLDLSFDVRHRLQDLENWQTEWRAEKDLLDRRSWQLDMDNPLDQVRGMQIEGLQRLASLRRVRTALEITSVLQQIGAGTLRDHLVRQYVGLSKEERLLWLNNLLFIMTPDLRRLEAKIARVRAYSSFGQQRNFLLGGRDGMGKTTFLDWYLSSFAPEVEAERNHLPVLRIDAPLNENTPKPLFQRIIIECGLSYLKNDNEETLLMKLILCFQKCGVEVLIVDEVEHISRPRIRRRLLEISNMTRGLPIICASCTPQRWVEGDVEVAGRWNDYFELQPYTGVRLQQLLAFIELLLPFSDLSLLALKELPDGTDGKKSVSGVARLIEQYTKGVPRDLMILLHEASKIALNQGLPCLTAVLLETTWKEIQTKPVTFRPERRSSQKEA